MKRPKERNSLTTGNSITNRFFLGALSYIFVGAIFWHSNFTIKKLQALVK
jgi:hypothetical protein